MGPIDNIENEVKNGESSNKKRVPISEMTFLDFLNFVHDIVIILSEPFDCKGKCKSCDGPQNENEVRDDPQE